MNPKKANYGGNSDSRPTTGSGQPTQLGKTPSTADYGGKADSRQTSGKGKK